MGIKSTLGALATATLLTVASPTTGLSQTTAKAQTSINNCLSTEPLINQMYEKVVKKRYPEKDRQGRIDELCKIMSLARETYPQAGIDCIVKNGTESLKDGSFMTFIALLAILDKNGATESGRDSKQKCKTDKNYGVLYDTIKKSVESTILVSNLEDQLNKATKSGK